MSRDTELAEAQKTIRILKEAINDALAAWDPLPPGEYYYSKEEHEARDNLEKVYEDITSRHRDSS